MKKKCSKCKTEKDISEFNKDKNQSSGLQCRCKECANAASRESYHKNPKDIKRSKAKKWRENAGKEYFAEKHLINTYGITLQQRNDLLVNQQHKCDICGVDEINAVKGKLVVDHCHTTGKVRSLLCHNCNTLIGHCKESEDTLLKAIQYLRKHSENTHG